MTYRIEMSRPALLDAEKHYLWLKNESEEAANKWFKGLVEATNSLQNFPNRCPIAPESRSFIIEIRQLLYGKGKNQFRIIFGVSVDERTNEDVVLIYRIRHASQKYLSDLEIIEENIDE
jgi:plasmid stabilization system protein ParE